MKQIRTNSVRDNWVDSADYLVRSKIAGGKKRKSEPAEPWCGTPHLKDDPKR